MDLSQNALDIIQQSEGLVLNAAPDPGAGIPTIGYGTIAYPNGRKVEIGDSISPAEASAFLKFDCDRTAAGVTQALAGMAAGQNQFDALVSFAYNLGLGTLMSSTLLKKLKSGDFAGAAGEFPRFNKAMVRGVKVELPGLSARRA